MIKRISLLVLSLLLSFSVFAEPAWLANPSLEGHTCEVGSGPNQRIAIIYAKANLSRLLEVSLETETAVKNGKVTSSSTQTSQQLISSAKVKEEFFNGNTHFVLLCVG